MANARVKVLILAADDFEDSDLLYDPGPWMKALLAALPNPSN